VTFCQILMTFCQILDQGMTLFLLNPKILAQTSIKNGVINAINI